MSCDICTRTQASAFLCATCARNRLYQLRFDSASVILEREYLGQQIAAAINADNEHEKYLSGRGNNSAELERGRPRLWTIQRIKNEQSRSAARIEIVANHIKSLQSRIKDKNLDISQRKIKLTRQRSDSESAIYQLSERESGMLSGIQNNIKRTDHLWHANHTKTAEARIFLCREAASLYGLRQKVRKINNGMKETYTIGGVGILDLREMNGKSLPSSVKQNINTRTGAAPDHISASFSYIAHILVLVSNYLSLRLPAEITLPHKDYPLPTIYTPSTSYLPQELRAASFSDQLPSSSPTSRTTVTHTSLPRPRPLCIDRSLPKLAKEDPGTYALFIEGVALLAWNVSWLCRSQGLNLGSDSWEDVCDIGKNLWQLLVAPPGQSSALIATRKGSYQTKAHKDFPRTKIQRTKSFPMLGHYSHGTAHSFLGASEGTEFVRNWKLPSPTKVVDRLKSTLLGEMASAEWELLEENEWDDSRQPVFHESAHGSDLPHDDQSSYTSDTITLPPKLGAPDVPPNAARSKGTSGWTKLRHR
ncbi:UV radiation resistance protein and autophagy-related subunit 14-domain-containing protein [Aspergillus similis]